MTLAVGRVTGNATQTLRELHLGTLGPAGAGVSLGTVMGMRSTGIRPTTSLRSLAAALVLAAVLAACGSDDATSELPEGGTGSAYNDAIRTSESHDEIIFAEGGDMVVAVDCDPEGGGTLVTVVADGLEPGIYTGTFEPATGVDLTLDASSGTQAVAMAEMTLDEAEYTVTFADIEGADFNVRGC